MTPRLHADVAAALRRLGLEAEAPTAEALARIHRAHVERVPYETVWIHMGERWGIDPADSLRRIVHAGRGGYCYQLNGALALLLASLGYRVTRHVAGVHGADGPDPATLTNHLALIVHDLPTGSNPGGRWYADTGLGDGLYEPLPLQTGIYSQGPMRFALREMNDGVGDWHLTHDPSGSFAGVSITERPVGMHAFGDRHAHSSTSPDSGFARTVTAQLRQQDGTVILRNCALTTRSGETTAQETVDGRGAWFDALADLFNIRLAATPAALESLWARVAGAHERWLTENAETMRTDGAVTSRSA